jgi:hypothetical protein
MDISFSRKKDSGFGSALGGLYTCNSDSASMSIHVQTLWLEVYFIDNKRNILLARICNQYSLKPV